MSLFQRTAPFAAPSKQRESLGADPGGSGSGGAEGSDPAAIVAASYKKLDRMQLSLKALEAKAASMRELEELFELSPTRHTGLVEVRTQLRLLKMVWDTAGLVDGLFASWTATLWADIQTDELLDEARCSNQTPVLRRVRPGFDVSRWNHRIARNTGSRFFTDPARNAVNQQAARSPRVN